MEGICRKGGMKGFFKLIMDVPSLGPRSGNPAWEINQIFIWPSSSPSISGYFRMLVNGSALLLNSSSNLPTYITPNEIAYLLNNFYQCT